MTVSNDTGLAPRLCHAARVDLPPGLGEQATLEAVLPALAPAFPADAGRSGGALLVVAEDAGSATAVSFWRDALVVGPALASPGAFPWCLANAPCGLLARHFGITGPSVTWLATPDAAALAMASAWWLDHLAGRAGLDGGTADAWIVALRLAPPGWVRVWHWQAGGAPAGADIAATATTMGQAMNGGPAAPPG